MRRRTQLMRENSMKFKDKATANIRRNYLNLRNQILEEKYGHVDQISLSSNNHARISKTNSKAPSIDSASLNYEWKEKRSLYGFNSNIATALNPKHSSIYSSKESLNSNSTALTNSTQNKSKSNIEETFAFAGVHHIFDNHKGAGFIYLKKITLN